MRKTTKLFLVLSILALILIAGAPAPGNIYTSEWRALESGASAEFAHGLGARPLDVHVWAYPGVDKNLPPCALPHSDFPGLTFAVDAQRVIVTNSGKPLRIQVYAQP